MRRNLLQRLDVLAEHRLLDEHQLERLELLAQHLGHRPVDAAVEIDPDANSGPTASRTAATLADDGVDPGVVSTNWSSSAPFIFTAVKPRVDASRAAAGDVRRPVAADPGIDAHPVAHRPPSSSWTGTPSALPLMSHSAWSMPGERAHVHARRRDRSRRDTARSSDPRSGDGSLPIR